MELLVPQDFEKKEIEAAKKLKIKLAELLPEEFESEFFLARWMRAYKDDEKGLELKLTELIEHRRAFGYGQGEILDKVNSLEFSKKTFERFNISQLSMDVFSDNIAVFIQKMDGCDLKEITKVIPLSYVLHSYFILHESFQRAMARKEAETGKPAAVAVVLDLKGLNLTDFINPMSGPCKLARLVVKIWSDYFTENMITLFLMHPPGVLSLMWQLAKHIVDAKTQSRIVFVTKTEDILKHLKPESIPVEWGGTRRDDSGFADPPESCCQKGLKITPDQYFDRTCWWKSLGFQKVPELKSASVKSKTNFEVKNELKEGEKLFWEFSTSSDFTFEVLRIVSKPGSPGSFKENMKENNFTEDEEAIVPKITLTSLKVPEHGQITVKHSGEYVLRWGNPSSSWLNAKLSYIVLTKK
ncbi:hypothetical protein FO519_004584 [Halicephalobus sp. NKZ332]|nr:hypothetical protein FO519_004584 [Halicephalobus sp. NKZ332]